MSDRYSDGVLDEKFNNIADKMDEQFEATTRVLADIKEQTSKTNGRVTKLEAWRFYVLGIVTVVNLIIIPLGAFLANQVFENSRHLSNIDGIITQLDSKPR